MHKYQFVRCKYFVSPQEALVTAQKQTEIKQETAVKSGRVQIAIAWCIRPKISVGCTFPVG